MENKTLRTRYKLDKKTTGVLVRKVHGADASYPLRVGDVITRIGDHVIDNAGMVHDRGGPPDQGGVPGPATGPRRPVAGVDHARRQGDQARRAGRSPPSPRLFSSSVEEPLTYFIFGPLSFTEATEDYISYLAMMYSGGRRRRQDQPAAGRPDHHVPGQPACSRDTATVPAFPGERVVIVPHPMFAHKISKGYDDPYADAVAEVNGVRIRNLKHLVEVIRDATGEYVEFTFQGHATYTLVFKRQEAMDATEEILSDNGIRQPVLARHRPDLERRQEEGEMNPAGAPAYSSGHRAAAEPADDPVARGAEAEAQQSQPHRRAEQADDCPEGRQQRRAPAGRSAGRPGPRARRPPARRRAPPSAVGTAGVPARRPRSGSAGSLAGPTSVAWKYGSCPASIRPEAGLLCP